jgi:hypothetical protein
LQAKENVTRAEWTAQAAVRDSCTWPVQATKRASWDGRRLGVGGEQQRRAMRLSPRPEHAGGQTSRVKANAWTQSKRERLEIAASGFGIGPELKGNQSGIVRTPCRCAVGQGKEASPDPAPAPPRCGSGSWPRVSASGSLIAANGDRGIDFAGRAPVAETQEERAEGRRAHSQRAGDSRRSGTVSREQGASDSPARRTFVSTLRRTSVRVCESAELP